MTASQNPGTGPAAPARFRGDCVAPQRSCARSASRFEREGRARILAIRITAASVPINQNEAGARSSAPSPPSAPSPESNRESSLVASDSRTEADDADGLANGPIGIVRAKPLKFNAWTETDGADANYPAQCRRRLAASVLPGTLWRWRVGGRNRDRGNRPRRVPSRRDASALHLPGRGELHPVWTTRRQASHGGTVFSVQALLPPWICQSAGDRLGTRRAAGKQDQGAPRWWGRIGRAPSAQAQGHVATNLQAPARTCLRGRDARGGGYGMPVGAGRGPIE